MCPVSSEEAHFSRSSTLERHPTNGLILRHTHLDSSILTLRVENKGDSVEQPDACDVHCRKGSEKSFHFPHRYASFSDSHRRSRLRRRRRGPQPFFAGGAATVQAAVTPDPVSASTPATSPTQIATSTPRPTPAPEPTASPTPTRVESSTPVPEAKVEDSTSATEDAMAARIAS